MCMLLCDDTEMVDTQCHLMAEIRNGKLRSSSPWVSKFSPSLEYQKQLQKAYNTKGKSPFNLQTYVSACVPCENTVFSVASLPHCSSRTAEGDADQTLQCTARERWAEQREEAPCASDAPLQKKNEELKDVLWGRVISRSSSGSLGVSAVTRYAYSTGSPGVCKFLFLSHIWSCFLRLCLLFRSFKPLWRGGGEPKTFGSCLTQSDETRRGRGGWNYSDSFLSWVFSTREAELESVEDGDG